MKPYLILLSFLGFISNVSTGTLDLIINPEYKGSISIYDKPDDKVVATVKQDFENEDYLIFSVSNQTPDFFYGTLEYSISGKKIKGWVKKGKHVGIYARNYDAGKPLQLYAEANLKTEVNATVSKWTNQFYQVTAFDKKWVYVKVMHDGHLKQGWLSPEMQCANSYTTCN